MKKKTCFSVIFFFFCPVSNSCWSLLVQAGTNVKSTSVRNYNNLAPASWTKSNSQLPFLTSSPTENPNNQEIYHGLEAKVLCTATSKTISCYSNSCYRPPKCANIYKSESKILNTIHEYIKIDDRITGFGKYHMIEFSWFANINSEASYIRSLIIVFLRIKIPDLHISIFSILDTVVNHGQYILYAALKEKETWKLRRYIITKSTSRQ